MQNFLLNFLGRKLKCNLVKIKWCSSQWVIEVTFQSKPQEYSAIFIDKNTISIELLIYLSYCLVTNSDHCFSSSNIKNSCEDWAEVIFCSLGHQKQRTDMQEEKFHILCVLRLSLTTSLYCSFLSRNENERLKQKR